VAHRGLAHADRAVDHGHADALAVVDRERAKDLVGRLAWPYEEKLQVWIGAARAQSAVNHDGGSTVPAEEVDGDPRGAGRGLPAVRRPVGSRHPDPEIRPR
jgi:hypothetical protein